MCGKIDRSDRACPTSKPSEPEQANLEEQFGPWMRTKSIGTLRSLKKSASSMPASKKPSKALTRLPRFSLSEKTTPFSISPNYPPRPTPWHLTKLKVEPFSKTFHISLYPSHTSTILFTWVGQPYLRRGLYVNPSYSTPLPFPFYSSAQPIIIPPPMPTCITLTNTHLPLPPQSTHI